jgi:NADH-quinone oxidoreductase subunit H
MFMGGWLSPLEGILGPEWMSTPIIGHGIFWFAMKTAVFMFVYLWLRATFPRYRYDQIMRLGWKVFIPLTIVWIVVVGLAIQVELGPWFSNR